MAGSQSGPGDVAAALREVVAEHGPQALSRPAVISNLMKDVLPDDPRMARVVIAAAEEGIGDQLRDLLAQGLDAATAARLATARLTEATMFPPEACAWATGQIAVALGALTDADRTPTIVVPPDRGPAPRSDLARPAVTTAPWDSSPPSTAADRPSAQAPRDLTAGETSVTMLALVANDGDGTVTLIDLATGTECRAIQVGRRPRAIAITPDGATACVASYGDGAVTLIDNATATAVMRIVVGNGPQAITIAPDGATAYVANHTDGSITAISLPAGRPRALIRAVHGPRAIALDPAGATAYVLSDTRDTITPVSLVTGQAGRPVKVGTWAYAMAATPDGRIAYVASHSGITPVDLATGLPAPRIPAGGYQAIAITPDGATAYLAHRDHGSITPLNLATGRPGAPIIVGPGPQAIAITPDGGTAYVACKAGRDTLTPVSLATRKTGVPIRVGTNPVAIAIAAVIPSNPTRA